MSQGGRAPARARLLFASAWRRPAQLLSSAPGRVNLIGEHLDYNGGPVLPIAIDRRTAVAAAPARALRVVSEGRERVTVDPDAELRGHWSDYVVGAWRALARRGAAPAGARLAIASDVPAGAGLASSAALTVAVAHALARLAGRTLDAETLVDVAWEAEHDEVGVRCGRMDQTAAAHAVAGSALLYDPPSGERTLVPFDAPLWVIDTGVRHRLLAGHLNERRAECETALLQLRRRWPRLAQLGALGTRRLAEAERLLPAWLAPRVRHVVRETGRVHAMREALGRGDLGAAGALLFAGHRSLRDDFQSSCAAADQVVELAERHGALGARLTGAGWGGAVLVLPGPGEAGRLSGLGPALRAALGRAPAVWRVRPAGGVRAERIA